ncbi:MAG: site-specific integrase [Alphaproteobacteria bacterium]|nr:site-specific integrase [Alphaproteobacteria bacterium]
MPRAKQRFNLSRRFITSAMGNFDGKDVTFWDDSLRGFGLRVQSKEIASWIIMYYNPEGRFRKYTLGKADTLTPEEARKLAREKLADVAKGNDPAAEKTAVRKAITVSELCDWYLEAAKTLPGRGGRLKKASTLYLDKSRVNSHIKPLIGTRKVFTLTLQDIEALQRDIALGKANRPRPAKGRGDAVTGGRGAAARTINMFGTILEFARRNGIIKDNPARGVQKYAGEKRTRFLSMKELQALGTALRQCTLEGENSKAIAIIRALALTGCRLGEILSLRWDWIDVKGRCIRFGDTKTGAQIRPISVIAAKFLDAQPKKVLIDADGNESFSPWVFPAERGNGHFVSVEPTFERACEIAKLENVIRHTLRHTFASVAAQMGYSELTIAGSLGHGARGVTNRYSHLPDSALVSAANWVSMRIAVAFGGKKKISRFSPTNNLLRFEKNSSNKSLLPLIAATFRVQEKTTH